MDRTRGSGRKQIKPEYSAEKNLTDLMDAAVALYKSDMTLQAIADELSGRRCGQKVGQVMLQTQDAVYIRKD